MYLTVNAIPVPAEWQPTSDWDSHRPLLYLATEKAPAGYVLEMGCGDGSTPLLQNCGRKLYSFETNDEWREKYTGVQKVRDYNEIWAGGILAAIVFIDSAPGEQRKDLIAKWARNADCIVVHDTEPGADYVYGMKDILNSFNYRLDYEPEGNPHTTVVSNSIDVTQWVG